MEAEALYYVMYNDKVKGPFTFAQMQHFVLTNQISRTTFVMRKGANSWESAEQIAGLFPRIPEVPVNATPPVPSFEQKETGWKNAEPLVGTFSKTPEVPVNTAPPFPPFEMSAEPSCSNNDSSTPISNKTRPRKKHSKWVYGVACLLPGSGHILLKQYKRGIIFLIISAIYASALGKNLSPDPYETEEYFTMICGIPLYIFWTYVLFDCLSVYDKMFNYDEWKTRKPIWERCSITSFKWGNLMLLEKVFAVIWALLILSLVLQTCDYFSGAMKERDKTHEVEVVAKIGIYATFRKIDPNCQIDFNQLRKWKIKTGVNRDTSKTLKYRPCTLEGVCFPSDGKSLRFECSFYEEIVSKNKSRFVFDELLINGVCVEKGSPAIRWKNGDE